MISNGADFDDFAGLEYRPNGRFRVTHAGAMFGKRDPRPFLTAFARADLPDSVARFVGDFREADREWAEGLGLGERLELHPYVPRRRSLELQRDSEVNLLLMPEVPGRGSGVIAAKVFEYLAAERPIIAAVPPDGATAAFVRDAEAGVIVAPDDVDAIEAALRDLHARWQAGSLAGTPLSPELRTKLDRRTRAEELARVLRDALRMTRFLFLATVFSVTFEKVHWSVGGTLTLADVLTTLFLASFVVDRVAAGDWKLAHTAIVALAFGLAFLAVYLVGFFNLDTTQGIAQFGKGLYKFGLHFGFLAAGVAYLIRHGRRFALTAFARLRRGDRRQRCVRDRAARARASRVQPRHAPAEPADARGEPDQRLRLGRRRAERLSPERPHR